MPRPSYKTDFSLGRIPPSKDVIAYPLGHVWRRHRDHEAMVLRVKEEMEDAA